MDCLCCANAGEGPQTDTEFLDSVCGNLEDAKFPAEKHRYTLYLIAGCPFAARPWMVSAFYGLHKNDSIRVVKCFPAAYDDGWFFRPKSEGEHNLVRAFPDAQFDGVDPHHADVTHLRQLYLKAKPDFKGSIAVPLLWDTVKDTAVSNNSLGLSEMIATQMHSLATQNQDVLLFPSRTETPELYQQHKELVLDLHKNVTTPVYKINSTLCGREHDKLVQQYYATLDKLETRLGGDGETIDGGGGPYLMGSQIRFADFVLLISLIRLDLAYQWRFGLGARSVRENYPVLWQYVKRLLSSFKGLKDTVLPRDIMALYFLTPKFVTAQAGKTLPQVPESWATGCMGESCAF